MEATAAGRKSRRGRGRDARAAFGRHRGDRLWDLWLSGGASSRDARRFRVDPRGRATTRPWPDRDQLPEFAVQGQLDGALSFFAMGAASQLLPEGQWLSRPSGALSLSG